MKALSLIQPWATLVIRGQKHFETRSWQTQYRGPLLIHASKTIPPAVKGLCWQEPFRSVLQELGYDHYEQLPCGVILGTVLIENCIGTEAIPPGTLTDIERAFGDFRPGRYAWQLSHPIPLVVPWPIRGQRGLWDVPEEALQHLRPNQEVAHGPN